MRNLGHVSTPEGIGRLSTFTWSTYIKNKKMSLPKEKQDCCQNRLHASWMNEVHEGSSWVIVFYCRYLLLLGIALSVLAYKTYMADNIVAQNKIVLTMLNYSRTPFHLFIALFSSSVIFLSWWWNVMPRDDLISSSLKPTKNRIPIWQRSKFVLMFIFNHKHVNAFLFDCFNTYH